MAPVYEDGEKTVTLKGDDIAGEFQRLVETYVARRYPRRATPSDSVSLAEGGRE